ncbi:recQ-mediated genome instability protein 2 [Octopus sinensis]|uniref:RecQ-mediated genome instability protein 2 n=1 Tax=Octopus sinensis TaxID=2607531 RepID=A0A6P7SPL9_9MOLL|nr:recQ-mediated genome instability protein 2 [Octopus sinensis]
MAKISALPSWKLFISQLKNCSTVAESSSGRSKVWLIECCGQRQQFTVVWIQGIATQCSNDDNTIYLDDGTGRATVRCGTLPSQCDKLTTGQYGMVIGELLETDESPTIRAIKMQDLGTVPRASDLWKLEVIDMNLAYLIHEGQQQLL